MTHKQPEIGNWFENIENGQVFEIVALDDLHHTIEVQYLDGTLDEFDIEQWLLMPVVTAAAPEDANAAFEPTPDEQSTDTLGKEQNPLDEIEGETFKGTDESSY